MAFKYVEGVARILTDQTDILRVIGERVPLKRAGRNYKGLCPFHSEKTPSFVVSPEKQTYHCFGCGKSGDAVSFIMDIENLDFLTAIESLAERYGIDLEPYRAAGIPVKRDLVSYYEMNKQAARLFYANLKQNQTALEYLTKRGLNIQTIQKFGIGYAYEQWDQLLQAMRKQYSLQQLVENGLVVESGNKHYDRFRNRIIFPIIDLRKRVIAFGGRVIDSKIQPKYLNSPDTPVFNKSQHLFGLVFAKENKDKNERIYVVEGYMDVISLYDKEVRNVVASLGTAFTEEQAKLLSRYCKQIVLLYDGDSAGQKATRRAVDILIKQKLNAFVVNMPEGLDPDNYINAYGRESFLEFVENNLQDSFSYLLTLAKNKYDLAQFSGQRQYMQEAIQILDRVEDETLRNLYFNKVAKEVGMPLESLKKEQTNLIEMPVTNVNEDHRQVLLSLILQDSDIQKQIEQQPLYDELPNAWKALISFIQQNNGYNKELAIEEFPLSVCVLFDNLQKSEVRKEDKDNWKVLLNALLIEELEEKIRVIRNEPSTTHEEKLQRVQQLQRKRSSLY